MSLHHKHNSLPKSDKYKSVVTQDFCFIHLIIIFSGNWVLLHMEAVEQSEAKLPPKETSVRISGKNRLPLVQSLEAYSLYLSHYSVEYFDN